MTLIITHGTRKWEFSAVIWLVAKSTIYAECVWQILLICKSMIIRRMEKLQVFGLQLLLW